MTDPLAMIERLRAWRVRPDRDQSIAPLVRSMAGSAARTHRKLGELIDLWQKLVPAEIAAHTRILALRGSVLHVAVDSAPMLYELDRLLRSGVTDALRKGYPGALSRVRLKLQAGGE